MASPRTTKALPWLVALLAICSIALGVFLSLGPMKAAFSILSFGSDSESRNTQLVNSITREEQVVLLSLGIQGIADQKENSVLFGKSIPGSERTKFIQYTFNAKLGIEGKDVEIKQTGDGEVLITVPEFIFIGHKDENFRSIAENNGALSWATPEIDSVEMINSILGFDEQEQYIESNKEILKDQARTFYSGIVASVDPAIVVKFDFH